MDTRDSFTPTARARLRRLPDRGHYDRESIYAILDAGVVAHVGYVLDGQPYVTPTNYWREGDSLYWHGSSASRMLRALKKGVACCLTVTHLDGLVLARSGFHSSVNYRSVMAFGTARALEDEALKLASLKAFSDRLHPGRWEEFRPATKEEVAATTVLSMEIEEASAKVRSGPPLDDEPDYDLDVWAGVLPVRYVIDPPVADPRLKGGIRPPAYLSRVRIG